VAESRAHKPIGEFKLYAFLAIRQSIPRPAWTPCAALVERKRRILPLATARLDRAGAHGARNENLRWW
jgi:hypothetical protein